MPIVSSRVVGLVTLQPHERLNRERLTSDTTNLTYSGTPGNHAVNNRHTYGGEPPIRLVQADLGALMQELQAELDAYHQQLDAF